MTTYIKNQHTTVFTGFTGCGKTHLVLDFIENEYNKHFGHIIIICPTIRWNKIYHTREWIRDDDKVFPVRPKERLYHWIDEPSQLLAGSEILLFIIDDIIVDESLDKRRQSQLELAISGRHRSYCLWLLTQLYYAIPKNLRRQAKAIFVWFPNKRANLKLIHDENNVLTDDELIIVRDLLKESKHACLYIRNEHPRGFCVK